MVSLKDRGTERVEGYSRGMKQRLHVARTLLHDPQVLFLDEPTIGLGPVGAREFRQVILNLQSEGKTTLMTTHYMFEGEILFDWGMLLLFSAVYLVITRQLFRLMLAKARRDATLDME